METLWTDVDVEQDGVRERLEKCKAVLSRRETVETLWRDEHKKQRVSSCCQLSLREFALLASQDTPATVSTKSSLHILQQMN